MINGGSSSIRFALYKIEESLNQLFYGEIESIGTENTKLNFTNTITDQKKSINICSVNYAHIFFISRDYEKMVLQIVSQPVKLLCNPCDHE